MQNDVEVRFNVQAEYKQAMAAILALGKQLKALQEQSKLVLAAGGRGTGTAAGAGAAGATVSPEMAKALEAQKVALAGVSAEMIKTQQALQDLIATNSAGAEQLNKLVASVAQLQKPAGDDSALKEMAEQLKAAQEEITSLQEAITTLEEQRARLAQNERQRNAQSEKLSAAEIKRLDSLNAKMKYDLMTRQQLAAEIQRLTKLREEAALQENREAWDAYNEEIRIAHQSMEAVNRELTMSKIGLQQQAQTGLMVANTMGDMAQAIETGNINIGQMTMQVLSLTTAMKAGLGPIGWVMLAVQGLQIAWGYYTKAQEKAIEAQKKKREELQKAVDEITELEGKVYALEQRLANTQYADRLKEELQTIDRILAAQKDITAERERQEAVLRSEIEERKKASMYELEMQEMNLRLKYERGELTGTEYNAQSQSISAARDAVTANSASELLRRRQENASQRALEARHIYNAARDTRDSLGQQIAGRTLEGVELAEARRAALQKTLATEQARAQDLARQRDAKRDELELSRAFRVEDDDLHTELERELETLERDTARRADNIAQIQHELEELGEPVNLERFRSLLDTFNEVASRIPELEKQFHAAEESAQDAAAAVTRHENTVKQEQDRRATREQAQAELESTRQKNKEFQQGLERLTDSALQDIAKDEGIRGRLAREEQMRRRRERVGAARRAKAQALIQAYEAGSGRTQGFNDIAQMTSGERALTYRDDEAIGRMFNRVKETRDTGDDNLLVEILDTLLETESKDARRRMQFKRYQRMLRKRQQ